MPREQGWRPVLETEKAYESKRFHLAAENGLGRNVGHKASQAKRVGFWPLPTVRQAYRTYPSTALAEDHPQRQTTRKQVLDLKSKTIGDAYLELGMFSQALTGRIVRIVLPPLRMNAAKGS